MKFLTADSITPIYQTIINEFDKSLSEAGHKVEHIPANYKSDLVSLLSEIKRMKPDFILITNFSNLFTVFIENKERYLYELIEVPLIFIHHDNICHGTSSLTEISNRIMSYQNTSKTSWHFCLEYNDFLTLREYGFDNAFTINHASELSFPTPTKEGEHIYDVSFLGHILPPDNNILANVFGKQYIQLEYWNKVCDPGLTCDKSLNNFQEYANIKTASNANADIRNKNILFKYFFINTLHKCSQFFRGEVIQNITDFNVHIFGGDPSYLHGTDNKRQLAPKNFTYHAPVSRNQSASIYKNSKININITSLQFQSATINRVIDIGMVQGFVLTDYKDSLRQLTSVWKEISYTSTLELNKKIEYYLTHEKERLEIAKQLHADISEICTYRTVTDKILHNVSQKLPITSSQMVKIDLGCGPRKKEGFIGVDVNPDWPSVDVVADLTKRFPFPNDYVDELHCHDIIEHLPDRINTMNEIFRVCKNGAKVDIKVPSTDGRGAFQDPTHVSFWNINSFLYYSIDHTPYLELNKHYGFSGGFKILDIKEQKTDDGVVHIWALLKAVKADASLEKMSAAIAKI